MPSEAILAPSTGGKRIGPYSILEQIGVGSFATVFKAAHSSPGPQQIDSMVAIKAIEKRRLNIKLQDAIESEIEIMEKIRHKNIVRLFGCQKTKQHIYLVLEYCAGGDLHEYIRKQGTLSAEVARHFLRELAQGLEFLWKHALVHRDLKPHNLLLSAYSPTASLKIADFGFARHLGEALLAETLCGSPLYMAPEILSHHKYDAKADLWSVGTILFEMLAGKPPFSGANPHELLQNIQRVELRIPSTADTTPEAVDLLRRLLRRKPTERISFQEFFESKYLSLKPQASLGDEPKLFSNVDTSRRVGILQPVMEDADSSSGDGFDKRETGDEEGEDGLATPVFATELDPTEPASVKDVAVDDAWEFVEGSLVDASKKISPAPQHIVVGPGASRPPIPPNSSVTYSAKSNRSTALVSLQQQKRSHASGRATTFAVQVGERAVHLAKLAERIAEAYDEFEMEDSGKGCDCVTATASAIVVESIRLLSLSLAAAEDAADAVKRRNKFGGSTTLVQEIKAWMIACREKADGLMQTFSSTGMEVPNPKLVMYRVALGLGRRAAGRELLLGRSEGTLELVTVIEDYSLGLMILQLLTVNNDLSADELKQIHGFLALFHRRLRGIE